MSLDNARFLLRRNAKVINADFETIGTPEDGDEVLIERGGQVGYIKVDAPTAPKPGDKPLDYDWSKYDWWIGVQNLDNYETQLLCNVPLGEECALYWINPIDGSVDLRSTIDRDTTLYTLRNSGYYVFAGTSGATPVNFTSQADTKFLEGDYTFFGTLTSIANLFDGLEYHKGGGDTWYVANITNMDNAFGDIEPDSADFSNWCVTQITSEPTNFYSKLGDSKKPVWGTCPTPSLPPSSQSPQFDILDDDFLLTTDDRTGTTYRMTGELYKSFIKPWRDEEVIVHIIAKEDGSISVSNEIAVYDVLKNIEIETQTSSYAMLAGDELIFAGAKTQFRSSNMDFTVGPLTDTHLREEFYALFDRCTKFIGDGIDRIETDGATSLSFMFNNSNLSNVTRLDYNVENVTQAVKVFSNTQLGAAGYVQVDMPFDKVANAAQMFQNCRQFNGDVSEMFTNAFNLTSLWQSFQCCWPFNCDISSWHFSNVSNCQETFQSTAINQDLGAWDTSNVESMQSMFFNSDFKGAGVSSWNLPNLRTAGGMFARTNGVTFDWSNREFLTLMNLGGFARDTTDFNVNMNNVKFSTQSTLIFNLGRIFSNSTGNNFEMSNWNFTKDHSVNLANAFINTTDFNKDISDWNIGRDVYTSRAAENMFRNAQAFNQDLSDWCIFSSSNYSKPNDFARDSPYNMELAKHPYWNRCKGEKPWEGQTNLTVFHIKNNVSQINLQHDVDHYTPFFDFIERGKIIPAGEERVITTGLAPTFLFINTVGNWTFGDDTDTRNSTDLSGLFYNCRDFNDDISDWDMSSVTKTWQMFDNAHAFAGDLSSWEVGNVTNMANMFKNAKSFNSELSQWDVANVTNMSFMFRDALSMRGDLKNWCVLNFPSEPTHFGLNIDISWDPYKPCWSKCPPQGVPCGPPCIMPWDCHSGGVFHIKTVHSSHMLFGQVYNMYTMDGQYDRRSDYVMQGEERVVLTGTNTLNLFNNKNNKDANWDFGEDITDVSRVTRSKDMFTNCQKFNSPSIKNWDVSNNTEMDNMFQFCYDFNQDLSGWCVEKIPSSPPNFDKNCVNWFPNYKPKWGQACP